MSSKVFRFGERRYPDLKITSQGVTWLVDKDQVCAKSEYLDKEEKDAPQEGRQTLITLDEYLPGTVHRVLNYMYHNDYDEKVEFSVAVPTNTTNSGSVSIQGSGDVPLVIAVSGAPVAHEVKSAALFPSENKEEVESFSGQLLDNVLVAICAEELHVKGLQELVSDKICSASRLPWESFDILTTLGSIYGRVSREVQRAIAKACEPQEASFPSAFEKITQDVPLLAADVLRAKLTTMTDRCHAAEVKNADAETRRQAHLSLNNNLQATLDAERVANQVLQREIGGFREIEKLLDSRHNMKDLEVGKPEAPGFQPYIEKVGMHTEIFQGMDANSVPNPFSFEEMRLQEAQIVNRNSATDISTSKLKDKIIATLDQLDKAHAAEIAALTKRNTDLSREKASIDQKFFRFIQEPDNWDECRRCSAEFNGSFHAAKGRDEGPGKYNWCCDCCGAPHGWLAKQDV